MSFKTFKLVLPFTSDLKVLMTIIKIQSKIRKCQPKKRSHLSGKQQQLHRNWDSEIFKTKDEMVNWVVKS